MFLLWQRALQPCAGSITVDFIWDRSTLATWGGRQNTAMLKKAVSVSEKDIEDFLYLAEKGVTITAQMVPTDEAVDFTALLKSRSFQS